MTTRKPQTIPPSGMPAKAKQNHIVPTVHNLSGAITVESSPQEDQPSEVRLRRSFVDEDDL